MKYSIFKSIVCDIRNMKQLTTEQKNIIGSLTPEEKNEIIYLYDEMFNYIIDIIDCSDKSDK